MKTVLSLTLTVALIAAVANVAITKAAEPVAQVDIFEKYQSPPIWLNTKSADNRPMPDESDLPIQFRRGGARGGWDHGNDRGRIIDRFDRKKRAVMYDDNAHLSLNNEFGDFALVDAHAKAEAESEASSEVYKKRVVKREDAEDDAEEEEEEEENEEEENDEEADGEIAEEEDEDEDNNVIFSELHSMNFSFSEYDEDNQPEEDEAVDEEEERRLDSEAGLEDWIEEMKSEEYFNLAGHPTGEMADEDDIGNEMEPEDEMEGDMMFDEDEPSPSEEELFAASWHN
ncbi:hypothetical protein FBU30_000028 [Linnemannia zychae]|nr:hypothetical protein FBU30_000028 [Linnemannia zychae]